MPLQKITAASTGHGNAAAVTQGSMPQGKRKVKGPALLIKRYVDPNSKHVYYGQVTVGGETYSCGECVAMETAEGT